MFKECRHASPLGLNQAFSFAGVHQGITLIEPELAIQVAIFRPTQLLDYPLNGGFSEGVERGTDGQAQLLANQ